MHPRRAGFTLVEQLVALAIILILGATLVPHVIASVDRSRVDQAAATLQAMVDGTTRFNRDVRPFNDTKPFPGSLSQLTTPIASASASSLDICGSQYSVARANAWKGPYINRVVPAGGVPISIGTAQDAFVLVTEPVGDQTATLLAVEVTGVTIEQAQALNLRVDGDEPTTPEALGTVRWTPPAGDGEGLVTLQYLRPVPTC